jgi:hypothetical protein
MLVPSDYAGYNPVSQPTRLQYERYNDENLKLHTDTFIYTTIIRCVILCGILQPH